MRIVKGSTVMTRTTLKMATFMLATAIQPTQDQPNSMSDNVRQWSDSPTVPTVRQFRQFRQCPTVPDRARARCQTDSCPTVIRQSGSSDSPTVRQCSTVPDSLSGTVGHCRMYCRNCRVYCRAPVGTYCRTTAGQTVGVWT